MAWESLTALVRDEPGEGEDLTRAERVCRAFKAVDRAQRGEAMSALIEAVAAGGRGSRLIAGLAALPRRTARNLALLLAARLPGPLEPGVVVPLRPILADKRVPAEVRLAATAALLRTTGPTGRASLGVLRALTAGTGKARAMKRLRQLELRTGRLPVLDKLYARLRQRLRMRCPRCSIQLRRPEMSKHLWEQHQLVLDGERVREPWKLIDLWIQRYRVDGDVTYLARCQTLAEQLDGEAGLLRVFRVFLAQGIDHREGRQILCDEAERRGSCLCPRCFAWVPAPDESPARPLTVSHGRLAAPGYSVEVSDHGFVSHLDIEVPGMVVYRGPEPLWRLTRSGATLLFVGPPVVTALGLAFVLTLLHLDALVPVSATLVLALVVSFLVRLRWRPRTDLVDRAVHYAWTLLVPWLHREAFSVADAEFAASLALTSIDRGQPDARARTLEHLLTVTEKAGALGTASFSHLAMLWRLAAEDARTRGHDPVRWVLTQVGRCFEGKLPLSFAQHLLADWESNCWGGANLARLRVLLCDSAFGNGLEVGDLTDLGRVVPALADAMQVEDVSGLLQLRLLWSLRASQPWERCGEALSVFQVAENATSELLAEFPDLLLVDLDQPEVFLTSRGVVFRDILFTGVPVVREVYRRRSVFGVGYELQLDVHRFWFSFAPQKVLDRLLQWMLWYFHEFLPRLEDVRGWRSPELPRTFQGRDAIACPECRRPLLGRRGEVGVAVGA
jgi:hypothetical protein